MSTIKPAGGGDYTSLSSWASDAAGDSGGQTGSAGWHAECYKGGDLGQVNLASWTYSGAAAAHPKIYAADGQGHGGDKTDGAYIAASTTDGIKLDVDYSQVVGLRITCTNFQTGLSSGGGFSRNGILMDGCLVHGASMSMVGLGLGTGATNGTYEMVIRNNIIENAEVASSMGGIVIFCIPMSPAKNPVLNAYVYNNTLTTADTGGITPYNVVGIGWASFSNSGAGTNGTSNLNMENNYSSNENIASIIKSKNYEYGDTYYSGMNSGTENITASNNAQNDASGGLVGIDSSLVITNDAACFTTPGSDWSLKTGSPLLDVGKTPTAHISSSVPAAAADAIGTTRPQNSVFDMGAFEKAFSTPSPPSSTGLTGNDVVMQIISSNKILQGGLNVNSGGINFSSHGNNLITAAQKSIDRMDDRLVKSEGERKTDYSNEVDFQKWQS